MRDNAWRSGDLGYAIRNLTNATEYDVQVRAVNSAGDGEWSATGTGTPLPDDIPITLQWDEATLEVEEDGGSVVLTAVFTTTLNAPPQAGFAFDVTLTTTDSGTTINDDYTPPPSSSTFVASDFSQVDVSGQQRYRATRDFTVPIHDDTTDESNEVFRVTLAYQTPGLTHLQGGPSTVVVTIKDNEHVPVTISWEQSDVTVDEDDGSVTLRAFAVTTVDKRPEEGFSFDTSINTSDGSAVEPGDYTQVDETVTFSRNDFSRVTVNGQRRYRAAKQITVNIEDDSIDEIEEDFTVSLEYANPAPPHLQGGSATATVKIADDEYVPVTIGWREATTTVSEDGGSVTLYAQSTTTETGIPLSDLSFDVRVTTRSGSARQNSDYTSFDATETFVHTDFNSTFVNGELRYRAEKQITIGILDDILRERNENFTVRVSYSSPSLPFLRGSSATATITISDDENRKPVISTRRPPSTYRENGTSAVYTFRASDPQEGPITWRLEGDDSGDFTILRDSSGRGVLNFNSPPDFENPLDSNLDNDYELTVVATDEDGHSNRLSFTITITDVNEGPEISLAGSAPGSVPENHPQETVLARYTATDPENPTALITRWSTSGTDGGDFVINEQGELRFRNTPDYERALDSNRDNDYTFSVRAYDGRVYGYFDETVTVTPVNEPPTITTTSRSATNLRQPENRTTRLYTYRATDPEGAGTVTWSVDGVDERFFAINGRGQFSFSETSPPDHEQPEDSGGDNVYSVVVQATDDDNNTAPLSVTVTVTDVNEGPEISRSGIAPGSVPENQDQMQVLGRYSAFDPEGGTVSRWRTSGTDGGDFVINEQRELRFRSTPDYDRPADSNRDNIYVFTVQASDGRNYGSFEETVTVTNENEHGPVIRRGSRTSFTYREEGTSALYTYSATDGDKDDLIAWTVEGADGHLFEFTDRNALVFREPPDYEEPADSGRDHVYDLTVVATDSGGRSDSLEVAVTVTDVNEGPEVKGPSSLTISENQFLTNAVYTAADPEGLNVARWSAGGRDGGDFFITQGGTLYFRNPPDYERPADSNRDNTYEVLIQPSDGRNTGSHPVTVTVTDVNEPPEFNRGSRTSFTQPENRVSTLYTFRAADPERGTVTWSVAGTDGRFFTIDERGQFSFRADSQPDFDTPGDRGGDNLYSVVIEARDPESNTASLPVTVAVTEVNEGPVITRQGDPPGSVPENHSVTQVLATYTASDPERPSVKITQWSTSGRDGGDFVMNALGELRFRNSPDYDRPADSNRDNVYEVTVRASDGRYTSTLEEIQTVTVTGVNEPPTITTTSRTAFSQPENRTSTLYTFRATDPERGTITWSPGGTDGSNFTMDERGQLSFTNAPDFDVPVDFDRDNVYNVTVHARDSGANTSEPLEVTVTVTNQNERVEPTITTRRPPATYRENGTATIYTFRASDPQRGTNIRWSVAGTDSGAFVITTDSSGRGVLTFVSPPDFESPADSNGDNVYELAVVATDDEGHSDRVDFTITVIDHNEGVEPTISTRRPPSTYRENDTRTIYTFRASDPQRGAITWTVTGTDSSAFRITSDSSGRGILAFVGPPDFESPTDSNRDNEYELGVVATDDENHTDSVAFTITVTDINEGPIIRLESTATTTVPENHHETRVLADYTASDPENPGANIFRWSTSGRDGGDFAINELGELRFRNSPDYERPADSNRDNVYEVMVRASDGRSYGTLEETLMVTVTEVNEPPTITTKSRTAFSLRENSTSNIYTYRATDQDIGDAIRWSVEGADAEDFAIYNGVLNFRLLPDFEIPADSDEDNVYEITVVASDGILRDTVDAVISITDQPEGPVIAGSTSHAVTENHDIAQVLESYTATDAKDGRAVFPQWSLSGRDGGDFVIDRYSGVLAFRNTPDYDRPADSNRDNVYELTVRGHDSRAYGYLDVKVTVTPVNEGAPVVTGRETLSFRENTSTETRLYAYRASDPDLNTDFTWSVEGDDSDDFAITEDSRGQGILTFSRPPDYEQPGDRDSDNVYQVKVVASDGTNRGSLDVAVTVTPLNEGPVVSGRDSFSIDENQDLSGAGYTAVDPEATGGVTTTIRWSTSGRDGGDFTIDRESGVLAFRNTPDHERPADFNRDNVYEVTVRAHDGRNYGNFDVTVTVEDVAEITGLAALSRSENFQGVLATYSAAGRGNLDVEPVWRLSGTDRGDFNISEQGELSFRSIPDHERPADSNRDNVYDLVVQVSSGSYYGTLDVTVTVLAVNEGPEITGRDTFSYRENGTSTLYAYRARDPEGDEFTWHLGGQDAGAFGITTDRSGRGVLTFAAPPDFDSPTGSGAHRNEYLLTIEARDSQGNVGEFPVVVTVTDQNEGAVVSGQETIGVPENRDPTLTLATYSASDPEGQAITRWSLSGSDGGDFLISENGELTFRNTPDYDRPADSNRDNEYRVSVRAYDGRTYGSLDVTITVTNQNEHAPVIRSGSRTSFTYREEGTSVLYTYRATDGDRDDVITWTTSGADGNHFEFNDRNALVFSEPPDYEIPRDSGGNNVYELTVVATDSGGLTADLPVTVTVTEVNEGPVISGTTSYIVAEGQDLTSATFTARDPEDPDAEVSRWSLAGSDGGDFTITDTSQQTGQNSAQLVFRNTPDYDRPADSNRDNEYLVTVRAYNGSTYGSLDVTVMVTDQNESVPVVSGRDTLSFRENTPTTTRLYTYRASDADRDTAISWSVRGPDSDGFTINNKGELFFSSSPNYEQPTDLDTGNSYEITLVASDGGNEGTLDVIITVTDVNEGPEIAGQASRTVSENHEEVLATYTATDPEDPGAVVARWSTSGRDGGDFSINELGELRFRNPPDFERPADSNRDNEYEFAVRASDGRVYGAYDVTVQVEDVNEPPEFRSGSRTSFTYRENATSALYTYRATDPEQSEITWSLRGDDDDDFEISETGVLTFASPPDFDSPAGSGTDGNEYLVTVVATDDGTYGGERQLSGVPLEGTLDVTVTVTALNEGPEIEDTNTNTSITVIENHDQVLSTYSATDPDDPDAEITRWSTSGRDGGDFTINESGELTFRNPPDFERPADSNRDNIYEMTIRASDGRYYGTLGVTVIVLAVDESPEFRSGSQDSFAYQENGTSAIYTYRATDPESSGVTWGWSGTDSSAFTVSESGVLSFNNPPDYESPTDSGSDNVYELIVEASDEQSNTTRLLVTVTVTNLTDLGAPLNFRVTQQGNGQLRASWKSPDSGPSPDKYTVQWKQSGADWNDQDDVSEADVEETSHIITGLTDGVEYAFRVIASTDGTGSAPSKEATAILGATDSPAFSSADVDGAVLTITFNRALDSSSATDKSAFAVTVKGSGRGVDVVAVSDSVVTITLATAVFAGDTVSVDYTIPTDQAAAGLQDSEGNAAASFSGRNVSNNTRDADQLTATVPAVPESHDGEFIFEIRFSETPQDGFSYKTLRDHAFTVTGGMITKVRRLAPPSNVGWEIHVAPDGDGAVTAVLPATTDCTAAGAICTGDRRPLSNRLQFTVPGPTNQEAPEENSPAIGAPTISGTAQVGETLTASTAGISDANGLSNTTFSRQWLADDAVISGATGSSYTLVVTDLGKAIRMRVAFTDDVGNSETLTSAATGVVSAAPAPLTAEFLDIPSSHDRQTSFNFELIFSEELPLSYVTLRDHALTVAGGEVTGARRLKTGSNVHWEITVQPGSSGPVAIVLPATTECSAQGSLCTEDGRKLSSEVRISVAGPL